MSEAEKGWLRRVKQWQGWLAGDHAGRTSVALARLKEIRDPDALSALARTFRDDAEEERRLLYVAVLSKIEGDKPVAHLAVQSIIDESHAVREAAIRAVRRKDVSWAIPIYQRALKNRLNVIVNRAAVALGQLGDESTISHLIEALVTTHGYRALVQDENPQVSTDEQNGVPPVIIGPAVGLSMKGARSPTLAPTHDPDSNVFDDDLVEVELEKDEENLSVLSALTLLTGQNFGYDAPSMAPGAVPLGRMYARLAEAVMARSRTSGPALTNRRQSTPMNAPFPLDAIPSQRFAMNGHPKGPSFGHCRQENRLLPQIVSRPIS